MRYSEHHERLVNLAGRDTFVPNYFWYESANVPKRDYFIMEYVYAIQMICGDDMAKSYQGFASYMFWKNKWLSVPHCHPDCSTPPKSREL